MEDFSRIYYIKMTKSKTKRQKGKNNGKKNIQDQKERHAAVSAVSPGEGKFNSDHREIYERYEEIPGICIRRRGDREGKTAAVQRMAHGPLLCEQRQFHAGSPEPVPCVYRHGQAENKTYKNTEDKYP